MPALARLLPPCRVNHQSLTHAQHYDTRQPALAERSVGKTLLALLKPLLSDVEPSSRQLTALSRASLARLDTVPGGERVRSALLLLGFLDEEETEGDGEKGDAK